MADRKIWLVISRILWAFRIEGIPGEPINLNAYDGLSARSPAPFRVKMVPRDEGIVDFLRV